MSLATKLAFAATCLFLLLSGTSRAQAKPGCAGVFCIGDRVAHINFALSLATVREVNPEAKKVTVEFDSFLGRTNSYFTSNLTKLVPKGEQMRVFQVGYHVSGGHVIASNPESQRVTVLFDRVTNMFTYGRDELTYGSGCAGKICVGDEVKESRNGHLDTKVVGVNPASRNVTVFYPQLGSYYTYPSNNFTVVRAAAGIPQSDRGL